MTAHINVQWARAPARTDTVDDRERAAGEVRRRAEVQVVVARVVLAEVEVVVMVMMSVVLVMVVAAARQ